jgi:hypothetical protein
MRTESKRCACHAERRIEDVEARLRFEESVHGDRLVNPSQANPGMAAGRSGGGRRDCRQRLGTRLRPPPMEFELTCEPSMPRAVFDRGVPAHVSTVLLMPMQNCLSEEMRTWAGREGLLCEDVTLPALLKPYMQLPMDHMTITVSLAERCVLLVFGRLVFHLSCTLLLKPCMLLPMD